MRTDYPAGAPVSSGDGFRNDVVADRRHRCPTRDRRRGGPDRQRRVARDDHLCPADPHQADPAPRHRHLHLLGRPGRLHRPDRGGPGSGDLRRGRPGLLPAARGLPGHGLDQERHRQRRRADRHDLREQLRARAAPPRSATRPRPGRARPRRPGRSATRTAAPATSSRPVVRRGPQRDRDHSGSGSGAERADQPRQAGCGEHRRHGRTAARRRDVLRDARRRRPRSEVRHPRGRAPRSTATTPSRTARSCPYTVTVGNSGTAANGNNDPLVGPDVWDPLPTGITCAAISAISNGGVCTNPGRCRAADVQRQRHPQRDPMGPRRHGHDRPGRDPGADLRDADPGSVPASPPPIRTTRPWRPTERPPTPDRRPSTGLRATSTR